MLSHRNFIFRQLFETTSSTYTYILASLPSRQCVIIDPCEDTFERDVEAITQLQLDLVYCINTHVHADHITGYCYIA